MQAPGWTDFLQCSVCMNQYDCSAVIPVSLSCGHSICKRCLGKLKATMCPYDRTPISANVEFMPPNTAFLLLLGYNSEDWSHEIMNLCPSVIPEDEIAGYLEARSAVEDLALFLRPYAKNGILQATACIPKAILKKLVALLNHPITDAEGRMKALRAARSIADRTVTELLKTHQNQQQVSSQLWSAVRQRGCQFLGPVMQEEALKLILKVLESGRFLSRKNIVLYVVQQLQQDFPNASKTNIGHVVQLLYRASCFNVVKREDDSSLMQLKEEYRTHESLRREHDAQIIKLAMDAGLRITPEMWSNLLYGHSKKKSDMQSIIDKLISQGMASSGRNELIVAIGRSQDPYNLSEKLVPHLEVLLSSSAGADPVPEKGTNGGGVASEKVAAAPVPPETASFELFVKSMKALLHTLNVFTEFMQQLSKDNPEGLHGQIQTGRYKTGMCPYLIKPGGCPKGPMCPYAHSEDERKKYVSLAKTNRRTRPHSEVLVKQPSLAPQPVHATNPATVMLPGTTALVNAGGRFSGELATVPLQDSSLQSLTDSYGGPGSYPSSRHIVYQNSDRTGHNFVVQQQPLPLTGAGIPGMHLDQSEYLATAAAGYSPYQPMARSLDGSQEMLYDQPDFPTYQHHPQQTLLGAAERLSLDSSKTSSYTSFNSERSLALPYSMEVSPYSSYATSVSSYLSGSGTTSVTSSAGSVVGVASDLTPTSSQQFYNAVATSVSQVESSVPSSSSSYPTHSVAEEWSAPISVASSVASSMAVPPDPVELSQKMSSLSMDAEGGAPFQEKPVHYATSGPENQFPHPPPISTTAEYHHHSVPDQVPRSSVVSSAYPGDRAETTPASKQINVEELQARIQALEKEVERSRQGALPPQPRERYPFQRQHSSSGVYVPGISPHNSGLGKPPSYSGPVHVPQYSPSNTGTHAILPPATPPGVYFPTGTYPQQWSSPLPPARISPTTTPPHTGLLMPAMGHVMPPQPGAHVLGQPSARTGPHMVPEQQYLVDSDRMLAHYLQFLEQSKAIPRYPGLTAPPLDPYHSQRGFNQGLHPPIRAQSTLFK